MKYLAAILAAIVAIILPGCTIGDPMDEANGPNNLITNQYAFWDAPSGTQSARWEMTSGSLFTTGSYGWTGVPDVVTPNSTSSNGTGSAVFRLRTKSEFIYDATMQVEARVNAWCGAPVCRPAQPYDNVVIWPRYQSETMLYYADTLRKDGVVTITKKCTGGDPDDPNYANGGTYYYPNPEVAVGPTVLGTWYTLGASVMDNADGSVTVRLYRNGVQKQVWTDHGTGCAPIRGPGRVGIRSDNADVNFRNALLTTTP